MDLSDDELEARLLQRVNMPFAVRAMVEDRDRESISDLITEALGG